MKAMSKMGDLMFIFLTIAYGLFGIMEVYVLITMISYDYKAWKKKKEEERRRKIEDKFKNRKLTD